MIELDGSYGEGGGALVRTALALSALTRQEFKVTNIRSGRKDPGLKAQHLQAIKALKQICAATTNDIELGSTELHFQPGKINSGTYTIDIGTAGSISLLLQALIVPCLVAPGKITLKITGGTCGKWQASVDYLQQVLLPYLRRFVNKIDLKIIKRGYYPKGGGEVVLEIVPRFANNDFPTIDALLNALHTVPAINLRQQGTLEQIRGIVNISSDLEQKEVGERIQKATAAKLQKYHIPITIAIQYAKSLSTGGEIVLWAVFSNDGEIENYNPIILGADALVEKNKTSEEIGQEAATTLITEIDAGMVVDKHLADQLIIFMALLPQSTIRAKEASDHLHTNIYVAEKFLPIKFKIEEEKISVTKI